MPAPTVKMTPPRRRGLAVLLAADRAGADARVSNQTSMPGLRIYWQVADWLAKQGLARHQLMAAGGERVWLTDDGRQLAEEQADG